MFIFLVESLTWKVSFGGCEAWQASGFIFLIESLTWELSLGSLEDWGGSSAHAPNWKPYFEIECWRPGGHRGLSAHFPN